MKLILEIPQLSSDKMPFGYQKRLVERTILQIYEDSYISQDEFSQLCQKYFYQVFYQFIVSSIQKTITTELYQNRKSGTEEWGDILENITSSRIDKEKPPIWESK